MPVLSRHQLQWDGTDIHRWGTRPHVSNPLLTCVICREKQQTHCDQQTKHCFSQEHKGGISGLQQLREREREREGLRQDYLGAKHSSEQQYRRDLFEKDKGVGRVSDTRTRESPWQRPGIDGDRGVGQQVRGCREADRQVCAVLAGKEHTCRERSKEEKAGLEVQKHQAAALHIQRTTTVAATGYTSPAGAYKSPLGAEHQRTELKDKMSEEMRACYYKKRMPERCRQ